LEAEIVLRTVRHLALSENIPICVGSESGASVTLPSVGKRLYAKQECPLRDEQSGAAQRYLICYRKSTRDGKVFSF
jgi:hypothetical protein